MKALGNAVVPQVAYVLGSAILAYDAGLTGSVVEYVDEILARSRVRDATVGPLFAEEG